MTLQLEDLDTRHVDDLGALCGGCIYWEFPRAFDKGVSGEKARLMKSKWVRCNAPGCPVGRVALLEDQLVGFVQFGPPELYARQPEYECGPVGRDALFIACLFVAASRRGQGIGRRLLVDAAAAARARGYSAVETFARRGSANNPSGPTGFYEACGFEVSRDDSEYPLVRLELVGDSGEGAVQPN